MVLRRGWYASNTNDQTFAGGTTLNDLVSVTAKFASNTDYYVFGWAAVGNSVADETFKYTLTDVTGGNALITSSRDSHVSTGQKLGHNLFIGRMVAPGSGSRVIKLQVDAGATGTLTVYSAFVFVLEAAAGDQYIESDAIQTTTSAAFTTHTTLSWTAGAGEDFYILTSMETDGASKQQITQLFDGTTGYGLVDTRTNVTNNLYMGFFQGVKATLTGAQNWSSQFKSADGVATSRVARCKLLVLKRQTSENYEYAAVAAKTTTTLSTPQDKVVLNFIATGNSYFMFMRACCDGAVTSVVEDIIGIDALGATIDPAQQLTNFVGAAGPDNIAVIAGVTRPASGARQIKLQYDSTGGVSGVSTYEAYAGLIEFDDKIVNPDPVTGIATGEVMKGNDVGVSIMAGSP